MTTVYCTKGHDNQDSNRFCQICGEKLSPPLPQNTLIAGKVLEDRYRIVQQIGQGGFGRTYLCENLTRFNEPCVLKEFAPQVQGTYALDKAKKLFEREASVLHNLAHPQIPRFRELFELKTGSQGLFLVQDYVAGQTYRYLLAARQNQNRLFTEDEIRQLLKDTLPVLQYIHSLGVIHRDIAPDNLMLRSSDNLPVLIDFGGVKQIAVNAEIQATGNTEVPTCLGKVGYAPHEQMQRGRVSPNTDLYALAATCLVLLTGKEPTELIDPQSLAWNWRSVINLESDLGTLFDKMLQPNPVARFQSAGEVLATLKQQVPAPQMPVTQPPNPPVNPPVGTVVVSPGVTAAPKQPNAYQTSLPGGDSSFLKILGQSWMALLGVGAVGAIAWTANSIFNKPNTSSTPTPAAISTPSPVTPTSTPITESTPSPTSSSDANSRSTNNSSTGSDSSNTSKIIIGKPSNDKPSEVNSGDAGTEKSRSSSNGIAKPPKAATADSGDNSSSRDDRPRRNATNIITPPIRSNTDDEPVFRPSKPAPQAPRVEEFDTKPRVPKTPSESRPVARPPKVEEFDTKPRSPRAASNDQPARRPAKVEEFETKPRGQSASRPESATKPDNPDKPVKKSPVKKKESSDDDGPLF